jgi:C_GCAxxG_C_C family probable redox protein
MEDRMKSDEAVRTFSEGFNCAQAVFAPFAKAYGLGREEAMRIASSFGAGMGRMQETCGAVTGGLMALGLKFGFVQASDQERKSGALKATKDFLARFKADFGVLTCRELIGCDLNTEEGQKTHAETNQRELICAKCVARAASIVEEMQAAAR